MSAEVLPPPASPLNIGRFEVIGRLGQGAQSVVYLGYDPQLQREVALKAVHLEQDDARRAALLLEARAVSRLSHPGVVPVFEALETEDGSCLVFEYVAGRTLAERISEEGAMAPTEAVALLLPVLDALAYAHSHRIIHRDLKPSNILLDDFGRLRVMDFGIAVRHDASLGDSEHGFAMLGTPAYMAPEYAASGIVSPAMDVFSAGLVLYELLCGQRAVGAQDGVLAIRYLLRHDVTLPEEVGLACGESLCAILHNALARDPAARYASASDFAAALRDWIDPLEKLPSAQEEMAQSAAVDHLLARMPPDLKFPAPPSLLDALRRLEASGTMQPAALAELAMSDVSLMLELLRQGNSAQARSMGAMPASSLSAAVLAVLSLGSGAIFRRGLEPVDVAAEPTPELLAMYAQAFFCGMLSRELSGLLDQDGEEACIAGVLQQFGRLLLVRCFPAEASAILGVDPGGRQQQEARARKLLGIGLEDLAAAVAGLWGLPEVLLRSVRACRAGDLLAMPASRAELLRAVATLAGELSDPLQWADAAARHAALGASLQRYGNVLCLSEHEAGKAMRRAAGQCWPLLQGWLDRFELDAPARGWLGRVQQLAQGDG